MTSRRIARPRGGPVSGEVWRLLAALTIGLVLWATVVYTNWRTDQAPAWGEHWVWADLTFGIVAAALTLWRRRLPLGVAVATTVLSAVSVVAIGPAALAVVSLSTARRWTPVLAIAPLWFAAQWSSLAVYRAWETSGIWPNVVIAALSLLLSVAVGFYVGERRAYVAALRERALTAEREQAMRVVQARVAERTRIAREMHDVLAHRISLVAMHAGALSYRTDLQAEQVAETAEVIRSSANRALGELREVLGVLRDVPFSPGEVADADAPEAPQPTLAHLDELIDEACTAGGTVSVEVQGDLATVPTGVSRTAYRILQECLTNTRKHAPGHPVRVSVAVGAEGVAKGTLDVTARNGIRPGSGLGDVEGAGLGLIGLAERAVLAGGELTYGPDGHGDWVVHARLPWTR